MSTLIDNLVLRQLIDRAVNPANRRRATLNLTPLGRSTLAAAHTYTQARLVALLVPLSAADRVVWVMTDTKWPVRSGRSRTRHQPCYFSI
jgi:DNA-binding MarR family transcriptional regulator